jgi:transcriptional regulator with XRE-family HTH domain
MFSAKNFPARMRELREKLGMTQQALARRLGVFQTATSKWELGQTQPSHEDLLALCSIFGVTPSDLFIEPQTVPAKRGRGRPKKKGDSAPAGGTDTKNRGMPRTARAQPGKGKRGSGGS